LSSLPANKQHSTYVLALLGSASWCNKPAPPLPYAPEKMLMDLANYWLQQILSPAEMLELETTFEEEHNIYVCLHSTSFTLVSTTNMLLSSHSHGHHG
jgi:hypothetical protein